jgi:hypothetical protein
MNRLSARSLDSDPVGSLRARVSQLRQDVLNTTTAYRKAVAAHNSEQAMVLLRSRSRLMRELLETQCELLLTLRAAGRDELAANTPVKPNPAIAAQEST